MKGVCYHRVAIMPHRISRGGALLEPLALGTIVLAIVTAFSSRAVYMDEHIFLTLGRNALENPLYPSDIEFIFFGQRANLESHTHPPVGDYYLALVSALAGDFRENVYRILFAPFPILAAIAFYRLARRFTRSGFGVALLFVASPAFFVMSPTLMMDIPMLALFLAGLDQFLSSREGDRRRLLAASICFVLAAGTGYTVLVPLGCLFLWVLVTRPNVPELGAIAAAPAALVVWQAAMAAHFGHVPITSTVGYFLVQARSSLDNAVRTLSFLGGVSLWPWAGALLVGGTRAWKRAAVVSSLLAALAVSVVLEWPAPGARLWYVVLAGAGLFLLVRAASDAVDRREDDGRWSIFLLGWIGSVLAFFIVVGDMVNARYMLLVLPALYLLVFARARLRPLVIASALTLVLSITIGIADYRFVNGYRTWVQDVAQPLETSGYRVWSAAESGLRFYLEEAGSGVLAADSLEPAGGDLVVRDVFGYGLAEELSIRLVHARTDTLEDRYPIRTFSMAAGAGFHDSRFGPVPYTWSAEPYDRISIWQLSPLVGSLPQGSGEPQVVWSGDGPSLIQEAERLVFAYAPPEGAVLSYEIGEGAGRAILNGDAIELVRESEGPVLWQNLRVLPPGFGEP